jgi:hypothetical protein
MSVWQLTRRTFMQLSTSAGLMLLFGCPLPNGRGIEVYRRTGRNGHLSNAAKKHAANRLYRTRDVASLDLAHPGDRAKVVSVTISSTMFAKLFSGGKLIADFRRDL